MAEKLFKTFSDSLIKTISISSKRNYYFYDKNGSKVILLEKKIDELNSSPVYKIDDPTRKWSEIKNEHPLFLNLEFSISNIVHIFHGSEQSCYSNAYLGIALEWKPKKSKIKRCIKIGEISDFVESDNMTFKIENIEIKYPNNDIDFNWFIYVSKPGKGTLDKNERYGNSEGLILAKGLLWSIVSGGNASMFPIDEVCKPDNPLWMIRCNFEDWCTDEFSQENLAIILNQAHPLYSLIKYDSETYDELIFKEVLSSSFAALINQIIIIAKENGSFEDLKKDSIEEKGSILAAIKYFKNTLNINVDSLPNELLDSVKQMIDKENGLR